MGFLKSILNTVAENVMNEAKQDPAPRPTQEPMKRPWQEPKPVEPKAPSDAEWHTYFKKILTKEFPQYEIKEDVPVQTLTGDVTDEFKLYDSRPKQAYKAEWGKPYSFVLFLGGQPKGVVMLGGLHSHNSNVKYLISRMYAKKMGLPYINFYTYMINEEEYVVKRVKKFMN